MDGSADDGARSARFVICRINASSDRVALNYKVVERLKSYPTVYSNIRFGETVMSYQQKKRYANDMQIKT